MTSGLATAAAEHTIYTYIFFFGGGGKEGLLCGYFTVYIISFSMEHGNYILVFALSLDVN